jgi:hypothetical protein
MAIQDFSLELRSLLGGDDAPINKLEAAIQNYRNAVEMISLIYGHIDNDAMHKLVILVHPFQISLQEAARSLLRWRDEVDPRIAARRRAL